MTSHVVGLTRHKQHSDTHLGCFAKKFVAPKVHHLARTSCLFLPFMAGQATIYSLQGDDRVLDFLVIFSYR